MGNIRQARKNRSSTAKVTQKPKSKKKILHNPIVAANWNQKETLVQNYKRLGLAISLNDPTGGTQKSAAATAVTQQTDGLGIKRSRLPTKIDVTQARVVRDPETGAILQVIDATAPRPNPLNDPLNHLESDDDDDKVWNGFVDEHGVLDGQTTHGEHDTDVVRSLVAEATAPREKRVRLQSEREGEWIAALVDKHGDDYESMARDMKLNIYQQSAGDIKRRVKKWRAARQ